MRRERVGLRKAVVGVAGAVCVGAIVVAVALATSAGGSSGGYTVRAIFDDAGNLIAGENVEIDGVKVGTVGSVSPTLHQKAAVVLDISNPGFKNSFRADASCTIRPQGLIGEKYVECLPTQPRVEGTPLPPPLKKIPSGHEGEGEYLLPVENTHSPVDQDLLGDILRLPERERFTIIINELGAGLAGRGSDLNAVIRRANPALAELDKVLSILASENTVLAKLATDSAKALAPLARVREHVADFIVQSNTVSTATARHDAELARSLKLFPSFLEQLTPAVQRLGRFAEQTTPTFTDLGIAAPSIDKAFQSIPALSQSSTEYFQSLGSTSKVTGPALVATKPLLKRLKSLGAAGVPFTQNLSQLLSSVRGTGGLERLLDFIFLGTGASNGYDALGHFLRAEGVGDSTCLKYAVVYKGQCNRKLISRSPSASASATSASAASASAGAGSEAAGIVMARTLAVLKGATPAQAVAEYPGNETAGELAAVSSAVRNAGKTAASGSGGASANPAEGQAGGMLLNYLLGSD